MIRIIHCADVHLDSPLKSLALRNAALKEKIQTATRAAFTKLVDVAIDEEVAAILIAGDLFDGAERSARTAAFFTNQLDRLRAVGIRVFYIKGNHDAENPITGQLTLPDNVHVFDGRGGKEELTEGVWIHGVSFAGRHAPDSLLNKFHTPVASAINIAMLHTSLAGAAGHDVYAPCTVSDLANMGFDYWALGHVHRRQVHAEAPWIVMPGMPQGRDIGESGVKSATLLTIEEGIDIREVPTSVIEFLSREVDLTGLQSGDAVRDRLRTALQSVRDDLPSEAGIMRLTLTGSTPLRWQMLRDRDTWQEAVEQMAEETGSLWLDKLVFDLAEASKESHVATDELAELMADIRGEPGFVAACLADLEAIRGELPPQRREALFPDEKSTEERLKRLTEQGEQRTIALMKGSDS